MEGQGGCTSKLLGVSGWSLGAVLIPGFPAAQPQEFIVTTGIPENWTAFLGLAWDLLADGRNFNPKIKLNLLKKKRIAWYAAYEINLKFSDINNKYLSFHSVCWIQDLPSLMIFEPLLTPIAEPTLSNILNREDCLCTASVLVWQAAGLGYWLGCFSTPSVQTALSSKFLQKESLNFSSHLVPDCVCVCVF